MVSDNAFDPQRDGSQWLFVWSGRRLIRPTKVSDFNNARPAKADVFHDPVTDDTSQYRGSGRVAGEMFQPEAILVGRRLEFDQRDHKGRPIRRRRQGTVAGPDHSGAGMLDPANRERQPGRTLPLPLDGGSVAVGMEVSRPADHGRGRYGSKQQKCRSGGTDACR